MMRVHNDMRIYNNEAPDAMTQNKMKNIIFAKRIVKLFALCILIAQIFIFYLLVEHMIERRVVIVQPFKIAVLQATLMAITIFVIFNEIASIKYQEYAVFRGIYGRKEAILEMTIVWFRYMASALGFFTVGFRILTFEKSDPETVVG